MTGARPEVGAQLIHLPLSANNFCNLLHLEGPIFTFHHSTAPPYFAGAYLKRVAGLGGWKMGDLGPPP